MLEGRSLYVVLRERKTEKGAAEKCADRQKFGHGCSGLHVHASVTRNHLCVRKEVRFCVSQQTILLW